jgi:hypothetical protein
MQNSSQHFTSLYGNMSKACNPVYGTRYATLLITSCVMKKQVRSQHQLLQDVGVIKTSINDVLKLRQTILYALVEGIRKDIRHLIALADMRLMVNYLSRN